MRLTKNDQNKIAAAYTKVLNEGFFSNMFGKKQPAQQQPAQQQPTKEIKKSGKQFPVKVFGTNREFSQDTLIDSSKVIKSVGSDPDNLLEFRISETTTPDIGPGAGYNDVKIFIPFARAYKDQYPHTMDTIVSQNLKAYETMQEAMAALNEIMKLFANWFGKNTST